ncbi:MAG TPA: RNA polymerase sigma factor [Bryobacteraceae bacterium]|nr:RNA polymerase sigma factor [Bryobacteraceae bacterium]
MWAVAALSLDVDPDAGLETLMEGYQRGDSDAAARLIGRVSPMLHRYLMVHLASRRFAGDLLQETWLRIHQARHTYRPGEPVLPWLFAIARHVRVDHYRKQRRVEDREQQVEVLPERPQPIPSDGAPDFQAILEKLPESQREVVFLLKGAGMSLEEVARATSSSVGAVKQKAHRAYERLRELLEGFTRTKYRNAP